MQNYSPERIASLLKDLATAELRLGYKNTLNVFEAAALGRQEIKHSRMLAFLIDPSKGHCLGGEVLKKLVLRNFGSIHSPAYGSVLKPTRLILDGINDLHVECEWKNIDVLAYSESQKLVVAIENKIDAKESSKAGKSQLSRYADTIDAEAKFADFSKLFLYLTVDGDEPTDGRWCIVMHEDVLGFVQESYDDATHTGGMTTEASFFVKNYIDFLRRNVVTNAELEEECRLIYQHHKGLIDKIIELVSASGGVSDFAEEFASNNSCEIYANRSGRFAYLPKQLANAMPDGTLQRVWWNQQKPVLFWFYIDDKKKLKLICQVGPMKDKAIRNKLVNELFSAFGKESNRRVTDQYTVIVSEKTDIDEESDLLSKMQQLHARFEQKIAVVANLLTSFDFNPDINE